MADAPPPAPPGARDWSDAYANMAHIPGSDALPARWEAAARAFRDGARVEEGIAYGDAPRERLDLVRPEGTPRGLAVFVHGGYWMRTGRETWTHLARGAVARGWAVALPSYTLAPEARIGAMVAQVARAVDRAAGLVAGPVRLAGHSAGGHLVARLACADVALASAGRVERVLSISGLHDLRPLLWTDMNATLRLDEAEAGAQSPALLRPRAGARVTAWVGGAERPEFLRQARALAVMWPGLGATVEAVVDGEHDHFSVLDGLEEADAPITEAWVG